MAQFRECWRRRRTTLDSLRSLLEDAETNAERERRAAVDIQRLFRGQFVRATISTRTNAEIVIARIYRGHLARRRCAEIRRRQLREHRLATFHYYAVIIQKVLRGTHSRRTKLDFRERKAYVREIAQRGEEMRRKLSEKLEQQKKDEAWANDESSRRELVEVTQNLHHLVSTRAIPGVYNSPMLASTATAFGVPVETHIRDNVKSLISTELAKKPPPTKKTPYPPSNKATLQSAAPYDAPLREVRTQKKYHKLRRLGTEDFKTVYNSNQDATKKLNAPGINAGVPYIDEWENPYKRRGIPRVKEDLLPKLTTLGKPPKEKDKPFYLASGGNKSKVYANDRFDV